MKLDDVSTNIIKIALYADQLQPGLVSELWIDEKLESEIKTNLPTHFGITKFLSKTENLIVNLNDARRKNYLLEIFHSLNYQITSFHTACDSYSEFSKHAFGYEIKRVSSQEIIQLETDIQKLEADLGLSRQDVYEKQTVKLAQILPTFTTSINRVKELLPPLITNFKDNGFQLELVKNQPWSAFNTHIAPFTSKLSLNTDIDTTHADLYQLAFHEAYGGHHSELSQKDTLLLEGRGEHGLVITFSPQTFVSEAIAEGIFTIYQDKGMDLEYEIVRYYNRLTFALMNLVSFMYLDDKNTLQEIVKHLKQYVISDQTREYILTFSTDPLYCKYAPIYYTATDFFIELFKQTSDKDQLLNTLFTKPCTPKSLQKEFMLNSSNSFSHH